MLSSFVITLREGLEAALIIGLVLAALRKSGAWDLASRVWIGAGGAVGISLVSGAILFLAVGSLPEAIGQIVEGIAGLLAVAVLTFMVFWMRSQATQMSVDIKDRVRSAAALGSGWAIGFLAFVAVLREGLETALFLYASLTASAGAGRGSVGAIAGLALAVVLGYAIFRGSVGLNLSRFFQVTGAALVVIAAGMLAYSLHELQEVGLVPTVIEHLWDTNYIVSEDGAIGSLLKGLVGYNGNPSLIEVLAYWAYLGTVGYLFVEPHSRYRGRRKAAGRMEERRQAVRSGAV